MTATRDRLIPLGLISSLHKDTDHIKILREG